MQITHVVYQGKSGNNSQKIQEHMSNVSVVENIVYIWT